MSDNVIPAHLANDKRWRALFHLFSNHDKLSQFFTTQYFDMKRSHVKVQLLRKASRAWSQSEKFMLSLALHCYNERNKVDLADMDYLDANNTKLAFEALKIRYS